MAERYRAPPPVLKYFNLFSTSDRVYYWHTLRKFEKSELCETDDVELAKKELRYAVWAKNAFDKKLVPSREVCIRRDGTMAHNELQVHACSPSIRQGE